LKHSREGLQTFRQGAAIIEFRDGDETGKEPGQKPRVRVLQAEKKHCESYKDKKDREKTQNFTRGGPGRAFGTAADACRAKKSVKRQRLRHSGPADHNIDGIPWLGVAPNFLEETVRFQRLAVERDHLVSRAQAGGFRRAPGHHVKYFDACGGGIEKRVG
jgi:hypothetical protein